MKRVTFLFALLLLLSLPSLPVSAQDNWVRVRSKNFVLVGNAGEKQVAQVGARLEQFRTAFAGLFGRNDLESHAPTTVIIFKSHHSYHPFKPKPNTAGFFQSNTQVNYITLTTELEGEQDPFSVVCHEYTHLLVNGINPNMPIWFDEGLAEYYSTVEISNDRVILGKPISRHILRLKQNPLLPLKTLFQVDRKSPYYNEVHQQGVFYAQSWALMHYLMTGKEGKLRPQLAKFVDLLAKNLSTEDAFAQSFATSFENMESELRTYIQRNHYQIAAAPMTGKLQLDLALRPARLTEAEAQAHLGDLLLNGSRNEGEAYLHKAIELDPNVAMAHASLGLLRARQGKGEQAKRLLDRAVMLEPENYLWHYYYAYALSRTDASDEDMVLGFTPETIALMSEHLKKTLELKPDFREARNLQAFVNLVTGKNLEEAIEILRRSLEISPGRGDLVLVLAQIYIRQEDYNTARQILEPTAQNSRDDQVTSRARDLLAQIKAIEVALAKAREGKEEPLPPGSEPRSDKAEETVVDPSVVLRAALRKPGTGENQIQGTLMRVDCDDRGFTLMVKVGEKLMQLRTVGFKNLNFRTFTADSGREITCGPRMAGNNVVVTYVRPPETRTQVGGITRSIEFVPSDFKLHPEQ